MVKEKKKKKAKQIKLEKSAKQERWANASLVFRLNATLFFRQLHNMLWLDVVVCVLFILGLAYHTETTVLTLLKDHRAYTQAGAEGLERQSAPGAGRSSGSERAEPKLLAETVLFRDTSHVLYWTAEKPQTHMPPEDILEYLPEKLKKNAPDWMEDVSFGRKLYFTEEQPSLLSRMRSLAYRVSIESSPGWLILESSIGLPAYLFCRGLIVLLILEAFSALISLRRNGRSIARLLRPLQQLTASAQALSASGGRLSPEALQSLTGALDSINVSHLDAGIPLSGFSEELQPLAGAINEMLSRIDEAYREQIRFVSDASHELRTPIAVIQGYADLLSRWGTDDPETMRESIAAIRQEATAMKDMVEQLLFLARGENDFVGLAMAQVNISALVSEVLREIEMIDGGHQFSAAIEPFVMVEGDDGLLKQLLRILVDNSIKYTPAEGKIILRVEKRDGAQAAVIVQDEGVGIPDHAIPHIFDRFYRADESRTRETGGSGLGLSIAKWIAQRHHGSIEAMSRDGIGTRMTVLLPIADE
ncbi:MAG: HAMP domain-containing histidine kinase [Clostridiales bacterium]|nr:HAMP domain-containing histidine kinase [Clostridiales bacterium]